MRWILRTGFVVLLAAGLAPAPDATAQSGGVVLLTEKVELKVAAGKTTGTVSVINATTAPVTVTLATSTAPAGCTVTPQRTSVVPGRQQDIEIEVHGCRLGNGDGIDLTVTAGSQTWQLAGEVKAKATPPWVRLGAFPVAALLGGIVIAVAWARWDGAAAAGVARTWRDPLPGLTADYDFAKSWSSNATLLAGAFATFFGATDVRKAILGEDDEGTVAILVVAAALAVALVAAAPFVAGAVRDKDDSILTIGLVGAAFLTVTGTGGQLGVLVWTAAELDVPYGGAVVALGIGGGLLLLAYTHQRLFRALTVGVVRPKAPPSKPAKPSKAAKKKVDAKLKTANLDVGEVMEAYPVVLDYPRTSRGDSAIF